MIHKPQAKNLNKATKTTIQMNQNTTRTIFWTATIYKIYKL